jgi:DNA-binding SARP family transcriptional activator
VDFTVLGSLSAQESSRAVDLGGPRQRAVLGLLLIARGSIVPADRIVDDLWRGEPPPRAMGALQVYVSNLRRSLEPDRPPRTPARILVSRPPGYAIAGSDAGVTVDAWAFENAVTLGAAQNEPEAAYEIYGDALRLWQGPAYAEFRDESWAAPEIARLEELRTATREHQQQAALDLGRHAAAIGQLEAMVSEHPLQEESWRLLALALYRSGRQAEALGAVRRARAVLAEEIGVDPGPALQQLEADLLRQDPGLDWQPPNGRPERVSVDDPAEPRVPAPRATPPETPSQTASAAPTPPGNARPNSTWIGIHSAGAAPTGVPAVVAVDGAQAAVLPGREAELARILAAARSGRRLVLLSADPGGGKTALAGSAAATLSADGWRLAWGNCPEADGAPAAWAWSEVLKALRPELPDADPALGPLLDDQVTTASGDAMAGRFQLHRAVAQSVAGVAATRPVLLVLDDLHRADDETISILLATLGAAREGQLLVLGTYRSDETTEALSAALGHVARYEPERLHLTGLPLPAIAELVRTTAGPDVDDETVLAIADRTDGNPFYVRETARLLASEGRLVATRDVPAGVRDVVRRRLARLPLDAQATLRLAAVVGRTAEVDVLIAASETDEASVLDALEAGLLAGLLDEPAPGAVRFSHVLVRDTVYDDIPRIRRVRLHAKVGIALEEHRPTELPALAHHFAQAAGAGHVDAAVRYAVEAAGQAEARFASREAAWLLEQALTALDRASGDVRRERIEVLLPLVRAEIRAAGLIRAREVRAEAISLAREIDDLDLVVEAITAWDVPTAWNVQEYGTADLELIASIRDLLVQLPDQDSPRRCRLMWNLVAEMSGGDTVVESDQISRDAVAMARRLGDPELIALALNARYFALFGEADARERDDLAQELIDLGSQHKLVAFECLGHHIASLRAMRYGDVDAALERAQQVRDFARTYGLVQAHVLANLTAAFVLLAQGHHEQCEQLYVQLAEAMRGKGFDTEGLLWIMRMVVRHEQGRLGELVEATYQQIDRFPDSMRDPLTLILLEAGDEAKAREVWQPDRPIPRDYFLPIVSHVRAEVAVRLGDQEVAARVLSETAALEGQLAGAGNCSFSLGPIDLPRGRLAQLLGRTDEAAELYRGALTVAKRARAPLWIDQCETALALLDNSVGAAISAT